MTGKIYINAAGMPGYSGSMRGDPMEGDRSAWDAKNYPLLHNTSGLLYRVTDLFQNPNPH